MTLPKDPYEVTLQKKLDGLLARKQELMGELSNIESQVADVSHLIEAHELVLRHHRESSKNGVQTSYLDPYSDDVRIAQALVGLTQPQSLVKLAFMNDRRLKVVEAIPILKRHGMFKGNPKNVPASVYTLLARNDNLFKRIAPGMFELLPGAEECLPQKH